LDNVAQISACIGDEALDSVRSGGELRGYPIEQRLAASQPFSIAPPGAPGSCARAVVDTSARMATSVSNKTRVRVLMAIFVLMMRSAFLFVRECIAPDGRKRT
jgi:hypothetical protein